MTSKIKALSDEEFQLIVEESTSMSDALAKLGYKNRGTDTINPFKSRCAELGLDISHFARTSTRKLTNEEVFTLDSKASQSVLRRRFLYLPNIPYECAECGQMPEINGVELVLRLDHVNGDNHDNRIENLRWLCPNCDSQQKTYCGGNVEWNKE